MSAAAVQLLCFVYPLHEYCTTACLICQVVHHRKYLDRPSKLLAAVAATGCRVRSGVPFRLCLVALWFVLGGVWMLGGCAAAH